MKTYVGIPGVAGGADPSVMVLPTGKRLEGNFAWGKKALAGAELAKAILVDHMGESDATKFYRRFLYRTVHGWDPDKPWQLTSIEIDQHIEEMRQTERTAQAQARMPGRISESVADERGGIAGAPFSPVRQK